MCAGIALGLVRRDAVSFGFLVVFSLDLVEFRGISWILLMFDQFSPLIGIAHSLYVVAGIVLLAVIFAGARAMTADIKAPDATAKRVIGFVAIGICLWIISLGSERARMDREARVELVMILEMYHDNLFVGSRANAIRELDRMRARDFEISEVDYSGFH